MDFDPEHPKWLCCCCRLVNGLMILASSEIVLSVLLLLYSIAYIAIPSNPDEQYDNDLWFMIILIPISIMYGVTSALLFFGINKYKEKLLYPTLVARAIIVIFMQVFGVSVAVRPSPSINDVNWDESDDEKMHKNLVKKNMQKELTVSQRLMLLMFFMMIISIFVFYTLYLIVRCIRYIKAYKRLLLRKRSLIVACQINHD
ncbi:hypothetical protein LOAG_07703 [Loa loa]|uniref:DUF7027 domain-containing protein n=1 Tax=Loa loa TaxID=7209 RepID=A0A1S0TWY1_LOALO|nr:hypothetical protein LOAG_07703 [Loa loa]EFO20788.2 hypothetical protein LOAG_07703 [Loa loa]